MRYLRNKKRIDLYKKFKPNFTPDQMKFKDNKLFLPLPTIRLKSNELNLEKFFFIIRHIIWDDLPVGNYKVTFYFDSKGTTELYPFYGPNKKEYSNKTEINGKYYYALISFLIKKEKSRKFNKLNYGKAKDYFYFELDCLEKTLNYNKVNYRVGHTDIVLVIEKDKSARHLPANPTKKYNQYSSILVNENREPNGKFKETPSAKGIVTIFIMMDTFFEGVQFLMRNAKTRVEIDDFLSAFISHLDENYIYSFSCQFRKGKKNITINCSQFVNQFVTKYYLLRELRNFFYYLRRAINKASNLEVIKYGERAEPISHLKFIYKPYSNVVRKDESINSSNFNDSINKTLISSLEEEHKNIVRAIDAVISTLNSVLSNSPIYKNSMFFKTIKQIPNIENLKQANWNKINKKLVRVANKKNSRLYSTTSKHIYNTREYYTKLNKDNTKLNGLKNTEFYSTKSVFNCFFSSNMNKLEMLYTNLYKNVNHFTANHFTANERNGLKIAMQNFAKAVVNEKLDGVIFYSYKSLSEFLENFDPSFHLSKQSLSNYKRRKLIYKPFILNKKTISFFNYVKASYPLFDAKAFLYLCYKDSPKYIKYINWLEDNVN